MKIKTLFSFLTTFTSLRLFSRLAWCAVVFTFLACSNDDGDEDDGGGSLDCEKFETLRQSCQMDDETCDFNGGTVNCDYLATKCLFDTGICGDAGDITEDNFNQKWEDFCETPYMEKCKDNQEETR